MSSLCTQNERITQEYIYMNLQWEVGCNMQNLLVDLLAIKNSTKQRELVDLLESNPTSFSLEPAGILRGLHSALDNEIDRSLARASNGYLA